MDTIFHEKDKVTIMKIVFVLPEIQLIEDKFT